MDPVLAAGMAHLWFVSIHPFEDGNGRIARAIARRTSRSVSASWRHAGTGVGRRKEPCDEKPAGDRQPAFQTGSPTPPRWLPGDNRVMLQRLPWERQRR